MTEIKHYCDRCSERITQDRALLVARCGPTMQPLRSFHSRADGAIHGVTSCREFNDTLYVAAKGAGRIVAVDLAGAGARDS